MFTRLRTYALVAFAALLVQLQPAASEIDRVVLADGTTIEYVVILPTGYDPTQSYPAILAFPGLRQRLEDAVYTAERFFAYAGDRGVITFVPAAPGVSRKWYFDFGEPTIDLIPEFVGALRERYPIAGDKMHLAGYSNGGVSAFRAAVRFPELFESMTAFAGCAVEQRDVDRFDRLRGLRINLIVGRHDVNWADLIIETKQMLDELGIPATLEVVGLNGHELADLSHENSPRLFDVILGVD